MADELEPIKQVINIDVNENGATEATGEMSKLNAEITQSTTATAANTAENKKAEEGYKSFKAQLREANEELRKALSIHGETSVEAREAAKAVAELKDQMGFAKDLADSFNPDQKMKALGAATQVAGTGLQGVTAGMALFGGESEDTQKQLLKVQAAMAFSDAISNLSNLSDQWVLLKNTIAANSLVTKANTAATGAAAIVQNIFTGSVNTTSAGFRLLKLAIAGTGIGLLVVGLAAVVVNFEKISKWATNLVPGLANVGKLIGSIVEGVTDFIGVTSEADRAIDRLKSNADASLALNKKFLAEHGSQLDEFTKQKIEAKNEYNEAIKEDGANQVALAQELNRKLAKIEYSRGDEARKIAKENAEKAEEEAQKRKEEAAKKAADEEKKRKEKAIQDAKDLAKSNFEAEQETIRSIEEADKERNQKNQEEKAQRLEEEGKINTAILQKYADEAIKIEQAKAFQKEELEKSQVKVTDSAIGFLKTIAGKNKALQKAAIIAESAVGIGRTLIANSTGNSTAAAVAAPLLANPVTAVPAAAALSAATANNNIATGIGIASNIAATAKALSALGGGGGGSTSGGNTSQASQPSRNVAQVSFQGSSENQISTAIARQNKEHPPIQAFVVSQTVTDQQELDRKKQLNNSF